MFFNLMAMRANQAVFLMLLVNFIIAALFGDALEEKGLSLILLVVPILVTPVYLVLLIFVDLRNRE